MNASLNRYRICYHKPDCRYGYYSSSSESGKSGYELYLIFFFSIMFSAKLYVKYPQSTFTEERTDAGEYLGTYSVSVPCGIFLDEELTKEAGNISFTFDGLTIEECTPEHIYTLVMAKFEDSTHIS